MLGIFAVAITLNLTATSSDSHMLTLVTIVARTTQRVVLTGSVVQVKNCSLHWLTLELLMHITMVDRFIVEAAVTPVSDLPAPHGNTMMPDRALPLPNILDSDLS